MARARPPAVGAVRALRDLPAWSAVEGRDAISRSLRFASFNQAFAFMTRVAMKAEQLNHHPEWSNIYGKVDILLTTHEAEGVTELDVAMAQFIDAVAQTAPN